MIAAPRWRPIRYRGAPAVEALASDGARIVALKRGGQLVSWCDARGAEQLYLSPDAQLAGELPVRGGVPVIFPQFGAMGSLPRHGWARLACWDALEDRLALEWSHSASDHEVWPHNCHCLLAFSFLEDGLQLTFQVTNTGETPFTFTAALHTYLAAHSNCAAIVGLEPDGRSRPLSGPLDEILRDVPAVVNIQTGKQVLSSTRSGFADLVIWNPGPHHQLADLPNGAELNFACVEAAQLTPVHLPAGQCWTASETWCIHTRGSAGIGAHIGADWSPTGDI